MTKPKYTEDKLIDAARKLKKSFPLYARHILKIVDKAGQLQPFELNDCQKMVHRELQQQLKDTGRVRALVLKARQTGISTYVEGRYFWKTTASRNTSAFVLSHMAESTAAIFSMVETYYNNIPHPAFKPPIKSKTISTLKFDLLNSQYRVGTAKTGQTGRGQTNQLLHGSEVAYYPDADQIVAGILQTVGDLPGTEVVLESTANGVGGWFYERCMEALEGNGAWKLIFIPWFQMPEYQARLVEPLVLTDHEQFLRETYALTDGQLQFRRNKISELGSTDLFRQEYPSNPQEAFLTSGRCFVEFQHLDALHKECFSPDFLGDITSFGFVHGASGPLRIWDMPASGERYAIGVDVAEGLEHGDYSVAQVLNAKGQQVACWHGHVDPLDFGDVLYNLGKKYNNAHIAVERNNHGLTTLRRLQERGYSNLYVEQQVDYAYGDKATKKAGWLTTSKSKPLIIDNLAQLIRTGQSGIVDQDMVRECRTYVVDERGRTGAQTGCFDDRVMAYAIALFALNTMPRRHPVIPQVHNPADAVAGY